MSSSQQGDKQEFAFNFGAQLALGGGGSAGGGAAITAAAAAAAAAAGGLVEAAAAASVAAGGLVEAAAAAAAAAAAGAVGAREGAVTEQQGQPQRGEGEEEEEEEEEEEWIDFAPAQEETCSRQAFPDGQLEEVAVGSYVTLVKGRVTGSEAAQLLGEDRVEGNDLLPGIYEGGFKLWEGALDLCKHLCQSFNIDAAALGPGGAGSRGLEGKRVLELGCGHGLPGILCLMAGAQVHFQDYNAQVLTELTMPNVKSNLNRLPPGRPRPSCRYFSGDWAHTGELMSSLGLGGHYDLILTSESLYCEETQGRLLECIKQVLQPPHGLVLVASKTFYFGVGGGTKSFRKLVKRDGIFEVKSVACIEEAGSGNKREVLQLQFPEAIAPYFL